MEFANLNQLMLNNFEQFADDPALMACTDQAWEEISYREFGNRCLAIASALLKSGCQPGERAVIISNNRPEWAYADIGAILAGMVSSALYQDSLPEEIAYVLNDLEATVIFAENDVQLQKLHVIRSEVPSLRQVYLFDPPGQPDSDYQLLSHLIDNGLRTEKGFQAQIEELAGSLATDRPVCIIYTSGTTGKSRGVVLEHGHYLNTMKALEKRLGKLSEIRRNLSFLPLAHAFERIAGHYFMLYMGRTIAYARSRETLLEDMQAVQPNFVAGVPRFFEKVQAQIIQKVQEAPAWRQKIFNRAQKTGTFVNRKRQAGVRLNLAEKSAFFVAYHLVFKRLHRLFGGKILYFICGGAPLAPEILYFFQGLDLLLLEGWGATEATAPCTINHPEDYRFGSVGKVLPGTDIRVNDDQELEIRGPNVFKEYWRRPEESARSFTPDGFYRTGDLGRIDAEGWVYITGRKKQLIITAGGKNIAPGPIEQKLISQKHIDMAIVHGDRRKYLTALLVPDPHTLQQTARNLQIDEASDLLQHPLILDCFQQEVDAVNQQLPGYQQVKYFRILKQPFSITNGQLTHTLKQKRAVIEDAYRELLDGMY